ncbi:hypothetical protein F5Y01DRAFT_275362 [Xylaria sp. FL0043]|nr:hypothetical protein F5Y01DRAFT_275362 [Xylaria sp. FL0043]
MISTEYHLPLRMLIFYSLTMQSQPLPSNQSRYFYNGIGVASQNRGRLSPLPHHPSRSSGTAVASLRRPMPPFHPRQQPHPFLTSGPAAMGYIPQQSVRYYRNSALQEPIIPLRDEFSRISNVSGVDKSINFQSLEQARPNSVPSHYSQTLDNFEYSSQEILRPASVAHTSIQTSIDPLFLQPVRADESLGTSRPRISAPEDQCLENDFIPPKRILPFPTKEHAKTTSAPSETQRETMITESPSSHVVPTVPKENGQSITEKSQSKKKEKATRKSSDGTPNGAPVSSPRAPKRPRITFTNWHPPRHESKTPASRSTNEQTNKSKSQESQPSRNTRKNTKSGRLASTTDKVSARPTDTAPRLVGDSSHPHPVEVDRATNHEKHSVTHRSILEDSQSTMIGSQPEASQQSPFTTKSIRDKPSVVESDTLTYTRPKRSISQATTISTTSTKLSHSARDEDVSKPKDPLNRMSMIETTMVLQRDVTDIVGTRLQQGNADFLDVLGGEILMKMAMEDKEICEAVKRIL